MQMKKRFGAVLALSLALVLALSACGSKNNSSSSSGSSAAVDNPLAGKKIALIMRLNTGTFSAQYVNGVQKQVEKFGGKVTVITSNDKLDVMASNLDAAVNQHYDGILLDHGDDNALKAGIQRAIDAKIPVVAFDSAITNPAVTNIEQNDQKMAEQTLAALSKDAGGQGNIVKIWVGGFPPMESRQIAYAQFQKDNPGIKEIAAFGTADGAQLDAQTKMEAILKQYPEKGSITAVWASWDEFARGAATAIQQAGRDEIKVYGIDLSDEDLAMIQDPKSPWVASAAVDPSSIGTVQVRYLYQKIHGDTIPASVQLDSVYVSRDTLPADKKVTTADLSQYVQGWGATDEGTTDYLTALETAVAGK